MKDFFDIWLLCENFDFDGSLLSRALAATFARRGTSLPQETPLALTPQFAEDISKVMAWNAFMRRNALQAPELSVVVQRLQTFLMPPMRAAFGKSTYQMQWQAGDEQAGRDWMKK